MVYSMVYNRYQFYLTSLISIKRNKRLLPGVFAVFLAIVLVGCAGRKNGGVSDSGATGRTLSNSAGLQAKIPLKREIVGINTVLVLPPRPDNDMRQNQSLSSAFTDGTYYRELADAFRAQNELEVVAGAEVPETIRKDFPRNQGGPLSVAEIAGLGKKFAVDAVLSTTVHRFTERSGSAVGANVGAEVDFAMELRSVADGNLVWSASYHYSDQAISENLLKVVETLKTRKGKGWVTARQALSYGFASASKELALARQQAFLAPVVR